MPTPLLAALALLALAGCAEASPGPLAAFRVHPVTAVVATCDDGTPTLCGWSTAGPVSALSTGRFEAPPPNPGYGYVRLGVAGPDQNTVVDLIDLGLADVGLEVGREVTLEFEGIPTGTGGYPALRVADADGLAFYGVSLPSLPTRGALPLLDGWTVTAEATGAGVREAMCDVHATAVALVIARGGERVRLLQGESARLGDAVVQVRIAERLDYADVSCDDAFLTGISLVVRRA